MRKSRNGGWTVALLYAALGASACDIGVASPGPVAEQAREGSRVYAAHCARCHGKSGQGTRRASALIGRGALPRLPPPERRKVRRTEFRTAADVLAFVEEKMPFDDPGSLEEEEAAAVVAFLLRENGVALAEPLRPETAARVALPGR